MVRPAPLAKSRNQLQRRKEMLHPKDVMKPDLLSQILLVGSGTLTLVTLLVIVVAALTHVAAL
jgi:hypothetical protein